MLLYATVTSERASKGQGGKELDIAIKNEAGENVCTINVTDGGKNDEWPKGCTIITAHYERNMTIVRRIPWHNLRTTKGKRQKDEYHCEKHAWHCKGKGAHPCPHCN